MYIQGYDEELRKLKEKYDKLLEKAKENKPFYGLELYKVKRKLSTYNVPKKILRKASQLGDLVRSFLDSGNYTEALKYAKFMQKVNGGRNCDVNLLLAKIYMEVKDYDSAIKELKTALEFCPYNSLAYENYAKALVGAGKYDEALGAINKSTFYNNGELTVYNASTLVLALIRKGDFSALQDALNKIKTSLDLEHLARFYEDTSLLLTKGEMEEFLPEARVHIQYKEHSKKAKEVLDNEGLGAFTGYINNLKVPKKTLALLYLKAANLCEENKFGNLSAVYLNKARNLEDGTLNIGRFVNETERNLKLIKSKKRGN